MTKGTVKWFDDDKGFGFIEREHGEDVFVHYSEIEMDGYKTLENGTRVQFDTESTERGPAATGVKPLNGNGAEEESGSTGSTSESTPPASSPKTQQKEREQATNGKSSKRRGSSTRSAPGERETTVTKTFEELGVQPSLQEGLDNAGFDTPRPIQVRAIPPIVQQRDLVGTAPTGTGKTAAFLLPILQRLNATENETGNARALILAPTHELADQITEEARTLSEHLDLRVESVYGGTDIYNEMDRLEERVDVLVACPGRLLDHVGRRTVDLRSVEVAVLDEADRMCDMGFLPDIKRILARLPGERQNLFFSATIPPEIQRLAERMLDNPVKISVGRQAPTKTISHYVCKVKGNRKRTALKKILDHLDTDSVLIFCRTRKTVRRLARKLRKQGYDACPIEGGMESVEREATLSGFRRQSFKILVATNVAARGLDVEHISHVINYDIPEDPDVYTHRIGRTGRSGEEGDAFTLVTPSDRESLNAIEETIGYSIEERPVPSSS